MRPAQIGTGRSVSSTAVVGLVSLIGMGSLFWIRGAQGSDQRMIRFPHAAEAPPWRSTAWRSAVGAGRFSVALPDSTPNDLVHGWDEVVPGRPLAL
jgi:hypothetical protein